MVQRSQDFGFTLKAAQTVGVACELIGQNFDCDVALQFRVTCAIDFTHSALAEKSGNFERAKSCTYIYRHWISIERRCACGGIMPGSYEGSNSTEAATALSGDRPTKEPVCHSP